MKCYKDFRKDTFENRIIIFGARYGNIGEMKTYDYTFGKGQYSVYIVNEKCIKIPREYNIIGSFGEWVNIGEGKLNDLGENYANYRLDFKKIERIDIYLSKKDGLLVYLKTSRKTITEYDEMVGTDWNYIIGKNN